MRRLIFCAFLLCILAVPGGSAAKRGPDSSPGSLSVRAGRGEVVLQVKGAVIGRLASGKLTLTDNDPYDEQVPIVRGRLRPHPRLVSWSTTVYSGRQIRFRVLNGSYRLKIDGVGINLSAVGRGWVILDGDERYANPGAFALNGDVYQPIPYERTRLKVGGPSTPPSQQSP